MVSSHVLQRQLSQQLTQHCIYAPAADIIAQFVMICICASEQSCCVASSVCLLLHAYVAVYNAQDASFSFITADLTRSPQTAVWHIACVVIVMHTHSASQAACLVLRL